MKRLWQIVLGFGLLTPLGTVPPLLLTISDAKAQASGEMSSCQPPESGEFLLLVRTPNAIAQTQLKEGIPAEMPLNLCLYQDIVVGRLGGFKTLSEVQRLGSYIQNTLGLSGVIAQFPEMGDNTPEEENITTDLAEEEREIQTEGFSPVEITVETEEPPQVTTSETVSLSTTEDSVSTTQELIAESNYNPRALEEGYAVLIDYYNEPQLANQIGELTNIDVGLASYFREPYLLVGYTQNLAQADRWLQLLSDRGFAVMIVNSEQVILLTPTVN